MESVKTAFVMDFFKFPRTKHLFGTGDSGVSRDDLLMDSGEEAYFYGEGGAARGYTGNGRAAKNKGSPTLVAIEEKVDGANIGISIEPGSLRIRVQNRAHFVDSKTHRQFSTLDSWVDEHAKGLYRILNSDELVGHYVLFGEWLYAMHSIAYTRLPNYFLAFDLYDTKKCRFFSWRERNRRLEGTGISTVRLIVEEAITGRKDALKWMNSDSAYYDGPCEGIYLRIDQDMLPTPASHDAATNPPAPYCSRRGKLVRPDFLQGIKEQWTRQGFTKNIVQWS